MTKLYSNRSPLNLDLQLPATPWVAGGGCGRMRDASLSADVPTERAYDGMRVVQVRDGNNAPLVSYTRGRDLSGSLEGAGGIGGLLARSHGYSGGNWSTHNFYHADGGGNVTYLVNSSQGLAASYKYDAYGNTVASSGTLAGANVYRFSSKEWLATPGLYYYGYRWYAPSLQRWLNRDPIGEEGGINLYGFVGNAPQDKVDSDGRFWAWIQRCFKAAESTIGGPAVIECIPTAVIVYKDPQGRPARRSCQYECTAFTSEAPVVWKRTVDVLPNTPCPTGQDVAASNWGGYLNRERVLNQMHE